MKNYILTLAFVGGLLFSASAQENEKQMKDCQEFEDGYFIVNEGLIGKKYIIKRKGDKQIETDPDGTVFIFNVDWLNECSYTLELEEIAKNPHNINWQERQVITVNILETTEDGYKQRSVSNQDDLVFEKEMVKVKQKEAKKFLKNYENEDLATEIE